MIVSLSSIRWGGLLRHVGGNQCNIYIDEYIDRCVDVLELAKLSINMCMFMCTKFSAYVYVYRCKHKHTFVRLCVDGTFLCVCEG